jgi:hypothetical protein
MLTKPIITMRTVTALIALVLSVSTSAAAQQSPSTADMGRMVAELQASHIAANAPPSSEFGKLLERDVRAYLVAHRLPSRSVDFEPLRRRATQSGVSYPKYYLWVRATETSKNHFEGAMRVTAIDRIRFEIIDYTPAYAIRADPAHSL